MPGRRDMIKRGFGVAAAAGLGGAVVQQREASPEAPRKLALIVLDRSGSMLPMTRATIDGVNTYLAEQSDIHVGLIQFDRTTEPMITSTFDFTPATNALRLRDADFVPRGDTPLLWAVMEAISRMEKALRPQDHPPVIIIQTDGAENASPEEITKEVVSNAIKAKEAEGWIFSFMGAGIDAWSSGDSFGMHAGGTISYAPTAAGTATAWNAASLATRSYAADPTSTNSSNFYSNEAVASALTAEDLKNLTQYAPPKEDKE